MDRQITALLCRTSDRGPQAAAGTRELAEPLGARIIGSPGEPRMGGPVVIGALEMAAGKRVERPWRRHGVMPV